MKRRRLVLIRVIRGTAAPFALVLSDPLNPIPGVHCTLEDLIEIHRVTGLAIAREARRGRAS